jgi:hypothetical protein
MLKFLIEYAYLLGTNMSCCPVQASNVPLIGLEYVLSEVVVCYLSIAKRVSVLEREPRFVPYAHPCGRTMLKFRLRWSVT